MGGGGKGSQSTESSNDLNDIARQFFAETSPLRRNLIGQFDEALTTGGVDARIPLISRSQEQSRQATSNSLRQIDDQLAQNNLAGTPFGERIRAETLQSGEQSTAQIPTNIVMQMLQQIPGFVTGSNQTVVTGLGQAAGAEASAGGSNAGFLGSMLSPFNFQIPIGGG